MMGLLGGLSGLADSFSRFETYLYQTDKHLMTVKTICAYCIASRGKNQF